MYLGGETENIVDDLNFSQKIMMNMWPAIWEDWVGEWDNQDTPKHSYYDYVKYLNSTCYPILVENPYLAFALTSNLIHPKVISNSIIKNSVVIHKTSLIENNVQINDNVIIKENCKIHKNSIILENSVIGPNVEIFSDNYIMSSCVISNATIGNKCVIQHGSIIGGKGFGFTPKDKIEIQHIGNVIIGNNVDIGSNTTIDRGVVDSTIINDNVRIDNLVKIAHNVTIGKNSIIASQTGIAGSILSAFAQQGGMGAFKDAFKDTNVYGARDFHSPTSLVNDIQTAIERLGDDIEMTVAIRSVAALSERYFMFFSVRD